MFLAQINDILNQNRGTSQFFIDSWNSQWNILLNGPIYENLTKLGAGIALISIGFWGLKMVTDANQGKLYEYFQEMIWPIIVGILLTNNGQVLKESTLAIREILNSTSQSILTTSNSSTSLQKAYVDVTNRQGAEDYVSALMAQCQELPAGEQQNTCFTEAQAKIESELSTSYGSSGWVTGLLSNVSNAVNGITSGGVLAPVFALQKSAQEMLLRGFFLALQIAIQNAIELTWLVTACLGPLAAGASLIAFGTRSIFAWITAMVSVGVLKICFNVAVGISAQVFVGAENFSSLALGFLMAILSPLIALGLSAGGGLAVWSSLTQVASFTAGAIKR